MSIQAAHNTPLALVNPSLQESGQTNAKQTSEELTEKTQTTETRINSTSYTVDIQQRNTEALTYNRRSLSSQTINTQVTTTQTNQTEAIQDKPPLLDGAKNILNFIGQRIANEKENGASDADIDTLLQQGLAGFEQGYGEAIGELQAGGQLSEAVGDITSTLADQVREGIAQLRESYLGEENTLDGSATGTSPTAVATGTENHNTNQSANQSTNINNALSSTPTSSQSSTTAIDSTASLVDSLSFSLERLLEEKAESPRTSNVLLDTLQNIRQAESANIAYANKESFSFQLTTVDGDTINLSANRSFSVSGSSSSDGSYSLNQNTLGGFAIDVQGELDEGEQAAIGELLEQVFSLADDFYGGDIASAYDAALNLGFDHNEIAAYSLDLQQQETLYANITHGANSSQNGANDATLLQNSIFDSLSNYSQDVLDTASSDHKIQLIKDITEQIDQQLTQDINNEKPQAFFASTSAILETKRS